MFILLRSPLLLVGLATFTLAIQACSSSSSDDDDADDDDSTSSSGGSSGATGGSSGSGSATVGTAQCTSRCEDRLDACDVPEAQRGAACDNVCGTALTEAQLGCIEDLPCSATEDEIAACRTQTGSSSSSSGGSSGGENGEKIGDSCECDDICLGTNVCGGGDNRCVKLQNSGAICTIRCEDENDDSCPTGFSCQDAGQSTLGAELGFHCL